MHPDEAGDGEGHVTRGLGRGDGGAGIFSFTLIFHIVHVCLPEVNKALF